MKARLYGLLALMLCAMMVIMPAVAMGAGRLAYTFTYENDEPKYDVKKDDIIVNGAVPQKIALVYMNPDSSDASTTVTYFDTNGTEIIPNGYFSTGDGSAAILKNDLQHFGWRVKSIEDAGSGLSMVVEGTGSVVGNGYYTDGSKDVSLFVFNKIITPASPYGNYDTKEKIEAALNAKANQLGAQLGEGYTVYLREIEGYSPIDENNDSILRQCNPTGRFQISDNSLRGKSGKGWLIHMKSDGSFETYNIEVNSGTYEVNLTSFSPYAIVFKEGSTGGNGGSGVIAPSGSTAAPSTPNLPQTGDNSQLLLWSALALLSLTGAVLSIRRKKA